MPITVGQRVVVAQTCLGCGELKLGKHFAYKMRKYVNSTCHGCKNRQSKPGVRAQQELSENAAVKAKQPWTDRDIDKLLEMRQKGYTGSAMALTLGRTVYSVYGKLNKLKEEN